MSDHNDPADRDHDDLEQLPAEDALTLQGLAAAVAALDAVPDALVSAAKAALTWRTIDAELAALSFDSLLEGAGSVRSGGGGPRALSFEHGPVLFDLEIEGEPGRAQLRGQVVPAEVVSLELQGASGLRAVEVDPLGRFRVDPLTDDRFRLAVRFAPGTGPALVVTEWIAA